MKKKAAEERVRTALLKTRAMVVPEADWKTDPETGRWLELQPLGASRASFGVGREESEPIKKAIRAYVETWVIPELEAALRLVREEDTWSDSNPVR